MIMIAQVHTGFKTQRATDSGDRPTGETSLVRVPDSGPHAARGKDAVGHDEFRWKVAGQHLSEICIESLHLLRVQSRTNTVAGADPAAPRFVAERDVDHVAEALDVRESSTIERSDVVWVDAVPPGLQPSRVVLKHQLLRAVCDVAGERQIAERADDHATARSEDATDFADGVVLVEPPPAQTGTHEMKLSATCPVSSARPSTK